jgi:AraC-like DNA-binding protein
MPPEVFSTKLLHPRDQLEAWRDWYASVFDLTTKKPIAEGFPAEIRMWTLGGLAMSWTSAPAAHVLRTKRHLRRDPVDHWVISYCVRSAHVATTSGIIVEVPAKVPFLWSMGQDFLHERAGVNRVQFFLSRDTFRELTSVLDAALGSPLQTPLGCLLGDYMIALARHLPDVSDSDFAAIRHSVGAMVAAAVAPSARRAAVARDPIDLGRRERVRRVVRRHLRTPTLHPNTLGPLVGMSRSNLYRLFEDTGGIARYIRRQRLLEAKTILSDPAATQSIASIAEDLCFPDASAFARAFRQEFGCSPGEVRDAARREMPIGATQQTRKHPAGASFGDLLREF